jgi:hypothetical protein
VEQLVVRIARETGWGSERILGELRKLGVPSVCRTTVRNILKRHGIEPGPQRADPTWDTFLRRHAETLWACDFFMTRVLTERGWKWASVLAFIHVKTRRVIVTKATVKCGPEWSAEVAECLAAEVDRVGLPRPTVMVRDNDSRFGEPFDEALAEQGIRAEVLAGAVPTVQRPHGAVDPVPQAGVPGPLRPGWAQSSGPSGVRIPGALPRGKTPSRFRELAAGWGGPPGDGGGGGGEVVCRSRLGGVLRHYERRRAAA